MNNEDIFSIPTLPEDLEIGDTISLTEHYGTDFHLYEILGIDEIDNSYTLELECQDCVSCDTHYTISYDANVGVVYS